MSSKNTYIVGINAYDHDVSVCLLRNGEVAFAIAKERINRYVFVRCGLTLKR